MIRIVLVDPQVLFREAFAALLATTDDLCVVAQADDESAACRLAEERSADVVVTEIHLTHGSGVSLARELRRRCTRVRAIVLTTVPCPEYAARSLAAGALGFALKIDRFGTVAEAIRAVHGGHGYVSPHVATLEHGGESPLASLSPREREVFDLVVRGFTSKEIAASLVIARKTVETHRTKINRKLGAHSPVDLLRIAHRHGVS